MKIKLTVNNEELIVNLDNNSSSQALVESLENGPQILSMEDYASMEKVGKYKKLPTNDKQITAKPGDLILYLGSALVLYYESNSWNFTKLGSIENKTQQELKDILGAGSVNIKLENL